MMSYFSSRCVDGCTDDDEGDTASEMATAEMMRHEARRLMTYTKWPSSSPQDPARLAEAGFFYTGSSDRVKCAFCLGVLKTWNQEDIPFAEHRSHFPYCRFLQGKDVGNIPLRQTGTEEVTETTYQPNGNTHAFVPQSASDPQCGLLGDILPVSHTPAETSLAGTSALPSKQMQVIASESVQNMLQHNTVETGCTLPHIQNQAPSEAPPPPVVPDFTREVHRLATFSRWPEESTVLPEELARAGFYHVPQEAKPDRVRCGYCGGKVYGWQAGDDPWMEHARCFPTCPYMRLCLGEEMLQDMTAYMMESGR